MRAALPAGMVSEPAEKALKPARRASRPSGRVLESDGRTFEPDERAQEFWLGGPWSQPGALEPARRPFEASWEARSHLGGPVEWPGGGMEE